MDRSQSRKITRSRKTVYLLIGLLAGLLMPLLVILLASRIQPILPGATAIKLVRGCQATLMDKSLQPVFTISLDCPGVDSIRIWPLPIIQPFIEDWYEEKPGDLKAKTGIKLDKVGISEDLYTSKNALNSLFFESKEALWTVG